MQKFKFDSAKKMMEGDSYSSDKNTAEITHDSLYGYRHLPFIQLTIKPLTLQQIAVFAGFNDAALIEDNDFVGVANRAQAVGDDQGSAAFKDPFKGLLDQKFGLGIHRRGGLI